MHETKLPHTPSGTLLIHSSGHASHHQRNGCIKGAMLASLISMHLCCCRILFETLRECRVLESMQNSNEILHLRCWTVKAGWWVQVLAVGRASVARYWTGAH